MSQNSKLMVLDLFVTKKENKALLSYDLHATPEQEKE